VRLIIVAAAVAILLVSSGAVIAQEEVPVAPEEKKVIEKDNEIKKHIADLNSDSWETREEAMKALIKIGLPAAKELEKLVDSEEMEVRVRAKKILEALHYLPDAEKNKIEKEIELCLWGGSPKEAGEEVKKLIEELSSDDWQKREDAQKTLVEKGLDALRPITKLAEKSEDPDLKDKLERIAKEIREKTEDKFSEQLDKSVEIVKGIKSSSYHIIELLKSKDNESRERIEVKLLIGILDIAGFDPDGPIIVKGGGGIVITQKVVMRNGKRTVTINGEDVTGLGKNPAPEKVLSHIAKNEKREAEMRIEAIKVIGEREATKAVEELVKLIGKSGGTLQLETANALRKLTGQEFGPTKTSTLEDTQKAMEEWQKWWEENKENEKFRLGESSK